MNNQRVIAAIAVVLIGVVGVSWGASAATRETVRAYDTDVYKQYFRCGVPVTLCVVGDGDTDLDVFVYDMYGNIVDSDVDLGDTCVVRWTPRLSGRYRIEVENLGRVYNCYSIWFE